MNRNDKLRRYPDLMVPFCNCPFKSIEKDCPFIEYWKAETLEEHMEQINNLPEDKLDALRKHHRRCLLGKLSKKEVILRV
jgi:hypothetical protein